MYLFIFNKKEIEVYRELHWILF